MKFFQTHTAAILLALMALMTADVALGYEFSVDYSADAGAMNSLPYNFDEITASVSAENDDGLSLDRPSYLDCGGFGEIEKDPLSSLDLTTTTADATSFTRSSDSAMATFSTHNQALTIGGLGLEVYGLSDACAPPVDDQQGTPHHTRGDDLNVGITYTVDDPQAAPQGNTVDEDEAKTESHYFEMPAATLAASFRIVGFPVGPMTLDNFNDDDDAQNNDDHGNGNVSVSPAFSF